MKALKYLTYLVIFLIGFKGSSCQDASNVEPVEMRPAIPLRFTATIMAVHRSGRTSQVFMAKEYYDLLRNKSAIVLDMPVDQHYRIILDFAQQKVLRINNGLCEVDDLAKRDTMFFGKDNTTVMGSASDVLGLRGDLKDAESGEVNGIPVRTWTHKLNLTSMEANVTLKASFAVSNWTFPHCFRHGSCEHWSRPVLLNVFGSSRYPDVQKHEVNLDYYFMDFIDDVDPQVFVPPAGVSCPHYQYEQRQTPFLVDQFSLESETYQRDPPFGVSKIKSKVYYDGFSFVVREDIKNLSANGEASQSPPLVTIMDGRDGVMYILDGDTNKCLATKSFDDSGQVTVIVPGIEDQHLSVISIYELILGNRNLSEFTYVGNRTCRLGQCQVWAKENDASILTELYFTLGKDNSDETVYIPVMKTDKWVPHNWTPMGKAGGGEQHFFNYQPGEVPDWSTFDISDCYEEKNRVRFQVLLKGPYNNITSLNEFGRAFRFSVKEFTAIQPLRMHRFMIDNIENTEVSVTLTLTEDPKYAGKIGTNEETVAHRSNEEVYNKIAEKVFAGEFKVMYHDDNTEPSIFLATSITQDIISEDKINENALILQQYTKLVGEDVSTIPSLTTSRIAVDDCAKLCDKENTFRCESFTYCHSTGTCKMLRQRIDELKVDFVANTDCNFYARNYTFDFSIWESSKLKRYTNEPKTEKLELNDCLRECILEQYDNFTCSSVDVCRVAGKATPACFYHRRHMLEVPTGEVETDASCLHFSRNYISEFTAMVNASIDNDQYRKVPLDGGAERCAQLCATDPEGCTDFEMCQLFSGVGKKTECSLMRPLDGATNDIPTIRKNPDCDHYRYKGVKTPVPLVPPGAPAKTAYAKDEVIRSADTYVAASETYSTAPPASEGFTAGEMGSLAVGTLMLGLLLGAATLYFVARRSATSGSDQGIVMKLIGRPGL